MKPYYQDKWVTIYHGDCRELLQQLEVKVDLVLTDPPYLEETLWAYKVLADYAHLLKDGKFLYAYCGAHVLPQVIQSLKEKLTWDWLFNIKHNGGAPRMWSKRLMVTSKPVVVFTRGPVSPDSLEWCANDHESELKDKSRHRWGQSEGFPAKVIGVRTKPSELVLDPFMGSGTTCFCAKKLLRYSIGIEIEERYCEITARRCSQEVMELV